MSELRQLRYMQRYYTENSKQISPEKELRGLSPDSYIHVSLRNVYIPTISLHFLRQEYINRFTDMDVEIGTVAAQFLFWQYINRNFFAVLQVPN
jgi:hypothetical protein